MARKSPNKISKVQVAFEALSIEGGLLSPEWLSKIAQLQADAQTQSDYKVPKGLTLRDEIGRYWRIAEALWNDFQSKSANLNDASKVAEDFVTSLLKQCLGFDDLQTSQRITLGERVYPIGQSSGGGKVPIVISSPHESLDTLSVKFGEDHRKRSAFGLLQEYLNASENVLWGVACDGETLRVVRDNASLTKPAWIEADLRRMFQEARYADFAAFWLVCHRTRFGEVNQNPVDCILERWRNSCRTEGTRARDQLRIGVEEALEILGQGFISHAENSKLREILQSGKLSVQGYFQELLRLIYRIIFLVTIEERDLLHPSQVPDKVKELYNVGYSARRLRDRSIRRNTFDKFSDLWESLKIVFKGIENGEERLGLPALGGLFDNGQTRNLVSAKIENRFLLQAVLKLCWLKEESGVSRVNWRDMGPEELGSVYESLLELVPQLTEGGSKFSFARGDETAGNARKLSGSYYTPDELVQSLLETTLDPIIDSTIKANINDPVTALLALTIVDPACGSAHFLLAAARRLAGHVARLQVGGTPTAQNYRKALRQVISHCIYGVDKNPMALELARTALWLESMTPDAPLTFLDHHLVCGDALLGILDLQQLSDGIPGEAYKALIGDDKEICKSLASENAKKIKELKTAKSFDGSNPLFDLEQFNLVPILRELENMSDETPEGVLAKAIALENYNALTSKAGISIAADMFICAFLAPKKPSTMHIIPTTADLLRALRGQLPQPDVIAFVRKIAKENGVFHWKLTFPHVFSKGGFDVVLGNPPWEKVQTEEIQFFSSIAPEISALSGNARKEAIEDLCRRNPDISERWTFRKRLDAAIVKFFKHSGRFKLTSVGKFNTYALFSELSLNTISRRGRAGIIVPTGIATDDTTKDYFKTLVVNNQLVSLFDFENRMALFQSVHRSYRFSLLTIDGAMQTPQASLMFFAYNVSDLKNEEKRFNLSKFDISTLNPNTFTCATFRSKKDALLSIFIQKMIPIFLDERSGAKNKYNPKVWRLINTSDDSESFVGNALTNEKIIPVIEAKTIHQFDHRYATYPLSTSTTTEPREVTKLEKTSADFESLARFNIRSELFKERLDHKYHSKKWFLTFRNITNVTNERTVIASIIPVAASCEVTPYVEIDADTSVSAFLVGCLNSYALDYIARQKVGGIHLSYFILYQLPIPYPNSEMTIPIEYFVERVLELTFTSNSLRYFAEELGFHESCFVWNDERRFQLRVELDAAFFHLYLPCKADGTWNIVNENRSIFGDLANTFKTPVDALEHVMESFPLVKKREEKIFGKFLSKELIIIKFKELAERFCPK